MMSANCSYRIPKL